MKEKNIQISGELFKDLIFYFDPTFAETGPTEERHARIVKAILEKEDSVYRRMLYSQSKDKGLTPEEREKARQAYLDEIAMPQDFRW